MIVLILLVLLLVPSLSHAATRYVDDTTPTGCSNPDTDYDPTANSGAGGCGSGTASINIGATAILTALAALSPGDTLFIRGGSYTGSGIYGDAVAEDYGGYAPGLGSWETATQIKNYPGETVFVNMSSDEFRMDPLDGHNVEYVIWEGDDRSHFVFDGGETETQAFIIDNTAAHIRFKRITIQNFNTVGGMTFGNGRGTGSTQCVNKPNDIQIIDSLFQENGNAVGDHGLYPSCSSNILVEYNTFFNNFQYGVHLNNSSGVTAHIAPIVRFNRFEGRSGTGTSAGVFVNRATSPVIYRNVFIGQGAGGAKQTIGIQTGSGVTGALILNNTIYDSATGIQLGASNTSPVIKNNILDNVSDPFDNIGGSGITVDGNLCPADDTTFGAGGCDVIHADPQFVSVGTNFALASGSRSIDAGVSHSGYLCNSTCDIGAFETFSASGASIDLNVMDITLGMNLNTPVLPASGMTGFTVSCSGTGCGTPVVASAARKSGTDSVIRLTISGITGDACAVGQTWTWSYTPGNVTDSSLIGATATQALFTASTQGVTEVCSGSGTPAPAGLHIHYEFEDASIGVCCDDSTANELDGTPTNSPTLGTGHTANGLVTTDNSTQYVAVPYGSGVNPSTQSLTIAFGVLVDSSVINSARTYFGSTLGTNQRFYISTASGTWRIGVQSSNDGTAGSIAVTSGWHRACLVADSGTDTATLYIDGVASTGGGAKTYTSYTFASNFRLGSPFDDTPIATYDDFKVWTSAESCADDFASWEQVAPDPTGTFAQVTHQWQFLRASATNYGSAGATVSVVVGGAVALITQIDCTVANCDPTGARLYYNKNGGAFAQVPDVMGSDQVSFYGTPDVDVLSGTVTCCLSGALTANDGPTNTTAAAVPVFDLAQNASFVRRSILKFGSSATAGDTYCFKEYHQTDIAMDSYTPSAGACVTIVSMSTGIGF